MGEHIHITIESPAEALADVWASIDGHVKEFRAGKGLPILDQPDGRYAGYMAEAEEAIERLERRGYTIVCRKL